jgi:hypothetical protein
MIKIARHDQMIPDVLRPPDGDTQPRRVDVESEFESWLIVEYITQRFRGVLEAANSFSTACL